MLQIPEKQESDKRKDSTSIHHFAAKLLKIIDFPIIFCNKSIIKVDDSLRAAKHPKQITEIIRRKLTFIFLRIFFYPTISPPRGIAVSTDQPPDTTASSDFSL